MENLSGIWRRFCLFTKQPHTFIVFPDIDSQSVKADMSICFLQNRIVGSDIACRSFYRRCYE
ncbi:hypothetical protein TREVI0001_2298 [Treponema vincentii ATCC 35580]|uniref:Uncharacterized protein n=1 Tax=Treponema vincentii ATCC 35580 TaxID=596324 RepID=C8PLZ6_9SPIR|nr:hypothetical protein TREVI0001_2298 [Treponema vincentii ATCC 35580]